MSAALDLELLGPGGRPFTDEQARAVLDAGGDLLLSAAAGSGKTSVLVERFARHVVEEDVPPARILAVTFTEKAAGELRGRVRARLRELGRADAARDADGAWISTVHGLCARLLRAHAVAAGLDPRFVVLDEPLARELRATAWGDAFAGWLAERGDAALDLAGAYGADRLRAAVAEAHDALRSAGHVAPRLPVPAPGPAPDAGRLRRAAAAAAAALAAAGDGKTVVRARTAVSRCDDVLAGLAPGVLPAAAALAGAAFRPGNAKALAGPECAAYLTEHERFAQACTRRRAVAAAAELDDLLARYAGAYAEAKRARGGLDFDDLELRARDLLAGAPAVRAAYRERFQRILVDEFQDSNPLQVELFALLGDDDVVTVGDEQQAIYGFRHADVEVFRRRRAALEPEGRALALTRNFRSRPEVVDVVNAVFGPRLGAAHTPLVAAREPAGEPRVELLLTDTQGWDAVALGDLPRAAPWRHAEARLLAQRIADLVAAGRARAEDVVVLVRAMGDLPVYERALEDAGLQTLTAGGRGWWGRQVVRDLCAWLAALANPRDELALLGVLASPLVGLSTDALALVAEAGTGNAWRAIERAFPGATATAPAPAPAATAPAPGPADAEERLAAVAAALPGRLGPGDRERLAAFRSRFAAERALAPRLGLDELLRRAVEASDYDLHVLRLPGGPRRLANVHKLLRLAAEHERAHGRDVRGLADRATAELEADARETDAPVELGDEKAVRLMTVHAAKGLEFPVVAVADLGRRRSSDTPALLVDGDRLGLRLAHLDGSSEPALDHDELKRERRAAEAAEEDRVLYVALTRAEERLILSGGADLADWPNAHASVAPAIAWLAPALAGGLDLLPGPDDPDRVVHPAPGVAVRAAVSTPATVGRVLREASLAPGGARLPPAPPPPARPAGPPLPPALPAAPALSYSALALHRRCGYRFYLQRVLGLDADPGGADGADDERWDAPPAPGPARLDARLRGVLVHDVLERDPGAGDARAAVAHAAARHGATLAPRDAAHLARLAETYAASPLAARVAAAQAVHREHPFALPLGAALLTGVVDVHATEAGGAVLVVDLKTDRVPRDADLGALVDECYDVQRAAYALAALRAGAPSVTVAYAFLERGAETVEARFAPADAPALEATLAALAAPVLDGAFPVAPDPDAALCTGCPGRRTLCPRPA